MSFESCTEIYKDITGTRIDAGKKAQTFKFKADKQSGKAYRLLHAGETGLFYHWRSELDYPLLYRSINDSLDSEHTYSAQYSLRLSSEKCENFLRKAYKKVMWPPRTGHFSVNVSDKNWRFGLNVTAKDLVIFDGGYLRARLEIHNKRENVDPHAPYFPPDRIINIDIPDGSYDWRTLSENAEIDKESTAYVGIWLEGKRYSGEVYAEAPFLIGECGTEAVPPFRMPIPETDIYDWTGQNLSLTEWPAFRVMLNGSVIFEGEIFERCHRSSEWELAIPTDLLQENNTLSYELIAKHPSTLPYYIKEISLIEQNDAPFRLISATRIAAVGGKAYLLIKTEKDNSTVHFTADSSAITAHDSFFFEHAGLHGIAVDCSEPCEHARFSLSSGGIDVAAEIERIVIKDPDNVLTGTGDAIYIPHNRDMLNEFISWYFAESLGNMITFRSTYRWTGARWLDEELWRDIARLMNELGEKYVVMLDGRELPGQNCNPDDDTMAGEGYLGRQSHERDGAIYYWDPRKTTSLFSEQYSDMAQRIYEEDPKHTDPQYSHPNYIYKNDTVYNFRDPDIERDMKIGMLRAVGDHSIMRGDVPRHTGPSVMFKYFLASGYDWVGAETMYTTMEPQMAFLRGANLCYGKTSMGVHHAMQWSSEPLDAPEHVSRYRLALYISYMQGATDINTEEGFWHLEGVHHGFTRFTDACIMHKRQQQDLYDYVASHTRSGDFHTPMALIHGRCDGWHAFGNRMPWGWKDRALTAAENSWDLLRVFYPLSRPGEDIYLYDAPTDKPLGYYSGTPLGNVDALPIESSESIFGRYRTMAFIGYNAYNKDDIDRLLEFVKRGGKLLLTLAHLTTTTEHRDIERGDLRYDDVRFPLINGAVTLSSTAVNGNKLSIVTNCTDGTVTHKTDDGRPLVIEYRYGEGKITFITASAYPSDKAIRQIYEELLCSHMSDASAKENVWASCEENVEFTVFSQPDGSTHVYFLAIDWYSEHSELRKATLRVNDQRYPVSLPFGIMLKAVVNGDIAAWPLSELGEVISISDDRVTVQGTGIVDFMLCKGGKQNAVTVDFSAANVRELQI